MGLSFGTISPNIRTAGAFIEADDSRAIQNLSALPKRILVLGVQFANTGVAPLTPTQIFSGAQAEAAFGRGSQLAQMIKAIKAVNPTTELWAIGLAAPAGGTARTFTHTFTGPATAEGTLAIYIGGELVQVAVATGDTASAIATNVAAAVNAQTDLPVTAAAALGVVTYTARWKGVNVQDLDVRVNYNAPGDVLPAGVTVTYAAGTAGAGSPDLTTAIAVFGDKQYTHVVTGFIDATALTALEAEMERRWGGMVMQDGLLFGAVTGTNSAMVTLGLAQNSKQLCLMGAGLSPTPTWIVAAIVAAVDAAEPNPARPRQTLQLPGMLRPAPSDEADQSERNVLLFSGISTYTVDGGGNCNIERLITTYQTNAAGVASTTYLDVTTMETLAALRYSERAWIALKFPRCSLASDDTIIPPGSAIVQPKSIKAALVMLWLAWADSGWVQGTVKDFVAGLTVVINDTDPDRVDSQVSPALMRQFRVFASQVAFL